MYCKHTNYEQATRVPLIIAPANAASGQGFARNAKAYAPVELLDLLPTIVELANLPTATGHAIWEGTSLVPMLKDPTKSVKAVSHNQYFRGSGSSQMMGYSVRSVRFRLTKWWVPARIEARLRADLAGAARCPWAGKRNGRRRALKAAALSCFNEIYDYVNDPWEQQSIKGGGPCTLPAWPPVYRVVGLGRPANPRPPRSGVVPHGRERPKGRGAV
jgi:arylsulfatase A-like enzyme